MPTRSIPAKPVFRRVPLASALAALGCILASAPAMALDVVATVKPVHALAAQVMAGIGTPQLLMTGAASPHTYSLRPSDARRLEAADLVIWVGPTLESPLAKPIATLARADAILTLSKAAGVQVLDAREGGPWEAHHHGGEDTHGDEERDGHIWLDPRNAGSIAAAIAAALAARDPANAERYRANAARASEAVAALDRELGDRLAPVRGKPFLVFHDAYQYLEKRYGLTAVGSITVSPERKPGARRIQALRRRLAETGAACVFSEPQFDPSLAATVTEGTKVRTAVLDPLGVALPPGPGLYPALMRGIADSLARCLAPAS